jgi:hypothetical protein
MQLSMQMMLCSIIDPDYAGSSDSGIMGAQVLNFEPKVINLFTITNIVDK